MRIENDRAKKLPEGEYTATMTKPEEGRIYSERGFWECGEATKYAKEAITLGWNAEVIGPDGKMYFIGGPA